jgi:tetraacyldisaccharide 4'-kinase
MSLVYALIQGMRAGMYRVGILTDKKLPRPVVSIGNIGVGGTGKTPVTAFIARKLLARGFKVACLSRGYGGAFEGQTTIVSDGAGPVLSAEQCGDEPFLLASSVLGLMVIIGTDRYAAGMLAMERLSPDIFLLDDGFQHLRLHRDLDILLLDCVRPFGNGWTLPAGLLREPSGAALRADWVVHTRCRDGVMHLPLLDGIPQISCRYRLGKLMTLTGGEPVEMTAICENGIVACAGIAEPEQFFSGLEALGLKVLCRLPLPDHAAYDTGVISRMKNALLRSGARYCVVTEKDSVKLMNIPGELADAILVAQLDLEMDGDGLLKDILNLL